MILFKEVAQTLLQYDINERYLPYVYEGFGLNLGLRMCNTISDFGQTFISDVVPEKYKSRFDKGCALRYDTAEL